MKHLFKYLSFLWVLLTPILVSAHPGHGLIGENHYHIPVNLSVLVAVVVVGIIAWGITGTVKNRK